MTPTIVLCALVLLLLFSTLVAVTAKTRVVTNEELAEKDGEYGNDIWLSIVGEVYDVTQGRRYYAKGYPYNIFSGRDASVCFATGTFTEEEAAKPISVLDDVQLKALDDWRESYVKRDQYPFIGVLQGEFYDGNGEPTEELKRVRSVVIEQRKISEQKEKERQARIKERKEKKAAKEKQQEAAGEL